MQPLRWERRPDGLRAPALVCAFKGWNDAGESATAALSFLGTALDAQRFATIDPEEFVDFQATRPTVRLRDGLTRHIDWPEFEVYEARIPRAPRDLILLSGPEPAIRWRTFCQTVVDLSEALGVQMVDLARRAARRRPALAPRLRHRHRLRRVARRPHRPQRLALRGPDRHRRLPPGRRARTPGIPAASLWAAVPHYVAVVPNPKGALALLRKLETLVGVNIDAGELETAAVDYERQVSRAVEMDPDVQAFVERLERAADEEEPSPDASSSRRATCWRASSSGSCGSAGRISRRSGAGNGALREFEAAERGCA